MAERHLVRRRDWLSCVPKGDTAETQTALSGVQHACEHWTGRRLSHRAGIPELAPHTVTHFELLVKGGVEDNIGVAWMLNMVCVSLVDAILLQMNPARYVFSVR